VKVRTAGVIVNLKHLGFRLAMLLTVLAASGFAVAAYVSRSSLSPEAVATPVARDAIAASGTSGGAITAQVGTRALGPVTEFLANFTRIARKGLAIACLDISPFRTRTDQARARVLRARNEMDRLTATLPDSQIGLAPAQGIADRRPLEDERATQVSDSGETPAKPNSPSLSPKLTGGLPSGGRPGGLPPF